MPFRFLCRSGLAPMCAAAILTLILTIPAAAMAAPAKSGPADLRVVDSTGETLAEHVQYTAETKVKARPEADCFGPDTGGSGDRVTVPGRTALGAVVDASPWDRDLRPVLVTDHFDFGLGVCGFGEAVAPSTGFWYLKIDHVAAQVGGDQAKVKKNDEVLWYLIEDFNQPTPVELELKAPARTDGPFEVTVHQYADNGDRSPAAGAVVTGAADPTDESGRTVVDPAAITGPLPDPAFRTLQATRGTDIPSGSVQVCWSGDPSSRCQSQPPATIRGTDGRDKIKGTAGDDDIDAGKGKDKVSAGDGDDRLDVKGGGRDVVRCGSGDDVVKADKRDVLKGCN